MINHTMRHQLQLMFSNIECKQAMTGLHILAKASDAKPDVEPLVNYYKMKEKNYKFHATIYSTISQSSSTIPAIYSA